MGGWSAPLVAKDVFVGATVAAVAVPAGLAMGELAGLSPVAGVYATMLPLLGYALFGSSRHLVVGPEGVLSALTLVVIAPLAGGDAARYAALAAALALLVGSVYLVAALLRLGFMADFLSRPVLLGFVNGTALLIAAAQLDKLIGIEGDAMGFFPSLWEAVTGLDDTHVPTLVLSAVLLGVAMALRWFVPVVPGALVVVVTAGCASVLLDLPGRGVSVVGEVTGGLPALRVPDVGWSDLSVLLVPALGLVMVGFADGAAVARSYARSFRYTVSPDRELAGLGAANLLSGLTQAFPIGSSASRTALNGSAGGSSQVVGLTAGVVVALVAVFAMPLVEPLPTAALGVVIIVACASLVDVRGFGELRRVSSVEALLAAVTLLAVLLLGVLNGVGVAVAVSIGVFVYRAVRPHDAVLGTGEGIDGYRDITTTKALTHEGLIVYRFDAPLFFANSPYFVSRVRGLVAESRRDGKRVRWFMVNMESVSHMDSTAVDALRDLRADLAEDGVELALARVKAPVRELLRRVGVLDELGPNRVFWSVRSGVRALGVWPPQSPETEE
ncbi:SulP family inorganic anion transporter [Nocardiopsis ganjiahuensis]|uniref:SulP family inorganic anion transporter n=1 Tax=Nocardiopsis ganjiahuensis TaxID=239984 RepID=UPI0003492578|nr:SulP family inorganic anion transporter [Nocardiopsis ganjiahuensis]